MRFHKDIALLLSAGLLVVALVLTTSLVAADQGSGHAAPAQDNMNHREMNQSGMAPPAAGAPPFERRMYADMMKMMRDMHVPGYTGNRDVDFLAMMIPHHQGAIDMARLVLEHGEDPLVRRLAEEIIASQQVEIEAMTARLKTLRRGADPRPGGFPALSGTRGGAKNISPDGNKPAPPM